MIGHNGLVARLTTPAFRYKPSAVDMADITKIYLVIKMNGASVISKDISEASISEDGYTWILSQEETQKLIVGRTAEAKIDYLTNSGMRYTTAPKVYEITDSAINEVI